MDAVKTLWERRVDAVWTLWGRCVHAITDNFDILGVFHGDPTARWHGFRTLYKRCGNAVWCDRGLTNGDIALSNLRAYFNDNILIDLHLNEL